MFLTGSELGAVDVGVFIKMPATVCVSSSDSVSLSTIQLIPSYSAPQFIACLTIYSAAPCIGLNISIVASLAVSLSSVCRLY